MAASAKKKRPPCAKNEQNDFTNLYSTKFWNIYNQNLRRKTEPVTVGADATLYFYNIGQMYVIINQTYTVAPAPTETSSVLMREIQINFGIVYVHCSRTISVLAHSLLCKSVGLGAVIFFM